MLVEDQIPKAPALTFNNKAQLTQCVAVTQVLLGGIVYVYAYLSQLVSLLLYATAQDHQAQPDVSAIKA